MTIQHPPARCLAGAALLSLATILTLVVIPVNYALFFRLSKPQD